MSKGIALGVKIALSVIAALIVLVLVYLFVLPFFAADISQYGSSELAPAENREFTESEDAPEGFLLVSEDDEIQLFINKLTTEIAIRKKSDGTIIFSNPQDRELDELAQAEEKGRLSSQIRINYYTTQSEFKQMDNYNHCIREYDPDSPDAPPFTIEPISKGVRITYTLGKKEYFREMLPQVVEKKRFEELILNNLDEEKRQELLKRYKLIEAGKATEFDLKDYENIRGINEEDLYVLRITVADYIIERLYNYIYQDSGYTMEDCEKDNQRLIEKIEVPSVEMFQIPIEYTVDDGALRVNVPCSAIVTPSSFRLTTIYLLEYFGSGKIGDNGYMFVPDGSGALINLNNKKINSPSMSIQIYGEDKSKNITEKLKDDEQAVMPVFGIKVNDKALFAIIEQGDAHAMVNADISERSSSYNKVYSGYEIRPFDVMKVSSGKEEVENNKYQQKQYMGNITIRYNILSGDKADYSGMAEVYRDYLIKKGVLKEKVDKGIPFTVEYLATAKDKMYVLGVPFITTKSLTTTEQAQDITKQLYNGGVENINVKYSAWFKGGYKNKLPDKAKALGKIGGSDGIKELNRELESIGARLYPDAAVVEVYQGFPAFNQFKDATRNAYNVIAKQYEFDKVGNYANTSEFSNFLLTPTLLEKYASSYADRLQKLGINNVWFRDVGKLLNTDFHRKFTVDREISKEYAIKALEAVKEKNMSIGLDTANIYAVKYADSIVNLPMSSSYYSLADESIPFVEMVLSGYMEYSGQAINLSGKSLHEMLKAVETGGGLYFKWIHADNIVLKKMYYKFSNELYSLYYGDWIDEAIDFYNRMKTEYLPIRQGPILEHEKLSDNVYKTTWEKGYVIVNYSDFAYTHEGHEIQPQDFKVFLRGE